ncbi:MAG: hypothetical protein FJY85_18475 [Deltaproteobacteria bacterium]|nr:hypothetical protein [Deltaproteobacteria bacterium]
MPEKRIIHAGEIVRDIRAGMTDTQLMKKYKLSARGLQSAFSKLIDNGIVTVQELYGHRRSGDDTVVIDDMRSMPRYYLAVTIPIYEASSPDRQGRLENVTERGLGVTGIKARIGETKAFVIPGQESFKLSENIWFEAKCMWAQYKRDLHTWTSGYQITKISAEDMASLRKLIKAATLEI